MMLNEQSDIAEILARKYRIPLHQVRLAKELHRTTSRDIGMIFIDLGVVDERMAAEGRAEALGIPYVDMSRRSVDGALVRRLPEALLRQYCVVPVERLSAGRVLLTTANPTPVWVFLGRLEAILGVKAELAVSARMDIERVIDRFFGKHEAVKPADQARNLRRT